MDESVIKHLEQPQVGTLKLSEAIRIGARLRQQGFGYRAKRIGTSCALEAAQEAVIGIIVEPAGSWAQRNFPHVPVDVIDAVAINLNDGQRLTREQIADWLEGQGY